MFDPKQDPVIKIGLPVQRANGLVDVPFTASDPQSVDEYSITEAEFSMRGDFTDAVPMSFKEIDGAHDGTTGLVFADSGTSFNLVWDAKTDLKELFEEGLRSQSTTNELGDIDNPKGDALNPNVPIHELIALSDVAALRFKPHFKDESFSFAFSPNFQINIPLIEETTSTTLRGIRGTTVDLTVIYIDDNGALFDPTTVEIVSVIDADGTEKIGSPIAVVSSPTGVFTHSFAIAESDPLGDWAYTFDSTTGSDTTSDTFSFVVVDKSSGATQPLTADGCLVFGTVLKEDGVPLELAEVTIFLDFADNGINDSNVAKTPVLIRTDINGRFEINLIKNSRVTVSIPILGYNRTGAVPNLATAIYTDII